MARHLPWPAGSADQRRIVLLKLPHCEACERLDEDMRVCDLASLGAELLIYDLGEPAGLAAAAIFRPQDFPAVYLFRGDRALGGWIGYSRPEEMASPADQIAAYVAARFDEPD